jgi:hypothetical protein
MDENDLSVILEFASKIIDNSIDLDEEIAQIINEEFWDLL